MRWPCLHERPSLTENFPNPVTCEEPCSAEDGRGLVSKRLGGEIGIAGAPAVADVFAWGMGAHVGSGVGRNDVRTGPGALRRSEASSPGRAAPLTWSTHALPMRGALAGRGA